MTMKKRICEIIISLVEKHGELVLAWNGVKPPSPLIEFQQ